jgi:hypothetical protein
MNKSDVRVTIDSVEKQHRAIEILKKYKEHIWEEAWAMDFGPGKTQLVSLGDDWFICYDVDLNDEIEISLDQLDELLRKLMNTSKIKVKIDSVEKQQKAIQLLQTHNQSILKAKDAMDFWEGCDDLVCKDSEWFIITDLYNRETITLEQLENLLKGNFCEVSL